jgi:hypothetical protein
MKLVILLMCLAGVLAIVPFFRLLTYISKRRNLLTATDVADIIERHIYGTEGPWDWDEFASVPIADDQLDEIRLNCIESSRNVEELKRILIRLRKTKQ